MKNILKILVALFAISALAVPAMAHGQNGGMNGHGNNGPDNEGDWLSPGGVHAHNSIVIGSGATVVKYTSTGHTFHATTFNPRTGVTTIVNPNYINTQLYSQPVQMADGSVVYLYGYGGYYPFGFDPVYKKFYFYGTSAYYNDYSINDPWFRTVALPFLRSNYNFVPNYSDIVFVSSPGVTYHYSSTVRYGSYGNWLGFA